MQELIIFMVGFFLGGITFLLLFGLGVKRTTRFIYRIKEDVPLEEIGKPTEQDYSGTE